MTPPVDASKRTWLIASGCAGAVGGAASPPCPSSAASSPPSAPRPPAPRSRSTSAACKPGEKLTVEWRGKPVWIVRRTPEQLAALHQARRPARRPEVRAQRRRADARLRAQRAPLDQARSPGRRRHLHRTSAARRSTSSQPGPQPSLPDDWHGGFLCPCHGSTFDLAGRVFKNKPAPDNLEVPPHMYLSDTALLIGEDKKA